ncbi:MAG: radical SAM protein [Pyrinomonadaceae bacterium]
MRQISNPPNPYDSYSAEFIGKPPPTKLEIYEEYATSSMITKSYASNKHGYRLVANCYRGCVHGCTYCFARRYHEFLGYGAGTDFDTKLVAKMNAPEVLRTDLKKTRVKIHTLEFSFTTDPYLPIEASFCLTKKCLEVCAEFRVNVQVITKAPLVTRDLHLLKKLNATVFFSIPFLTKESSNPFEPYAPVPEARFRAMQKLANEGVKVGIALAPIILGYNDSEIPALLKRAKECGASLCFMSNLHIDSDSIENYFRKNLEEKLPTKSEKIINHIRREKDGNIQHRNYQERIAGKTERWKIAREVFELYRRKYGFEDVFDESKTADKNSLKPTLPIQPKLF